MSSTETVIVSAVRTPIGSFDGALAEISAPRLGAIAIAEAVMRAGIDRGLVQTGRKLAVTVTVADKPGSLHRITEVLEGLGVNILQAFHDHDRLAMRIDQVEIALTLETKHGQHAKEVVEALTKEVARLEILR